MTIWSGEIQELAKFYESLKGYLPILENELERLINADDENMVLLYSRRCLEVIVTDLCEKELKRPRKTEPLKGIIDKLNKEEKVPSHIITSMHNLNSLSVFGTHPKEFDPQQVRPVLINLATILKWYMKLKNIYFHQVSEETEEKKDSITTEVEFSISDKNLQSQKSDLIKKKKPSKKYKKPQIWATALIVITTVCIVVFQMIYRNNVRWANEQAIPEIEQRYNELNMATAFDLVKKAEKYLSNDPDLSELASKVTTNLTILTDPPGAQVYIREYADIEGKWKRIGKTPFESIKLPDHSFYLMKIEKKGYENVLAVAATTHDTLFRKLFQEGTLPPGMVYVEGYWDEVENVFISEKNGFFIDRYEVTNKQFKEFVENGGYRNPEYWKHDFIKDGKNLSWEEAMAEFTDKSGRPGPATWEASDFPDGQDDYPVSGVSWYEAAAYAEYADKSLPTGDHWDSGAGFYWRSFTNTFIPKIIPFSNFNGKGPEPVGKLPGVNCYGAYDMAGNNREWCWNKTDAGRIISGGAWNDANYLYSIWSHLPPFDRSPENGFRCAMYIDQERIPESAFRLIEMGTGRDYSIEEPVPEDIFRIYRNQFLYDSIGLDAIIEATDDSPDDWIIEKITFNAAYGNERVIAFLYLPKNAVPPYQTLIFFPGSYAIYEEDLINSRNTTWFLDYLLKNGRAVMYPVYKGTYERNDGPDIIWGHTHQYTDWFIKWTKDFSRSIDYLETRPDIDISKIGFYGHSWGGQIGGIIPAVEERLRVNILVVGGFSGRPYPEVDQINYVSRINIPVLMLNSKYDAFFPLETTVKPFFDLLGTAEEDKRMCVYETAHYVPKSELIKETLAWLDKYFGPPNK